MNGKFIALWTKYAIEKGLDINKIIFQTLAILKANKFESKNRKKEIFKSICAVIEL